MNLLSSSRSWLTKAAGLLSVFLATAAHASEADLVLPDLGGVTFMDGAASGRGLLMIGIVVSVLGLIFGLVQYMQLKNLPVHKAMLEISELIYATCKTYLVTQVKFIAVLWALIAVVIVGYFGFLSHPSSNPDAASVSTAAKVIIILAFSVLGITGSVFVAWFGIRVNTFANSRTAFASLRGKPYPTYAIPLQAGISIGTLLI